MTEGDSRSYEQISSRKVAPPLLLYTAHSWNVQTVPWAMSSACVDGLSSWMEALTCLSVLAFSPST